ncbi:alkaline phosphatase D family protein [Paracoccus tegillarcae]|uniref:Alkaline phosphatase n=1 Tax=Paracoccus tegillarcae TaxID=1529068 RepID=A0A2K9EL84_9RHOB|nr:alkaline phosphatase D family protein [Paracoccus tegillarcae]AUH35209.1 alkaline phosphatase [Paracoccus tegillarcae]
MSFLLPRLSRRSVLRGALATTSILAMPAISRAQRRPVFSHGVQSGDINAQGGMVWTRADRPARIALEVSTTEGFADPRHVATLNALPDSDFAVKALLEGINGDQTVFYRMTAADLSDINAVSEPVQGQFRTAPASRRNIRFVWSGDTAGQGWGIDDEGMRTYATMAAHQPDFFIHSGDTIYADGPITDEVEIEGGVWRNTTLIDEVRKVAETLEEFRGRWKYNQMDQHVQAMSAMVPTLFQWDDHEVVNNWSPGKDLTGDDRYTEKSVPLLTARAARAFHEMTPISFAPTEPGRVYRKIAYGPLLDIFFLDLRSYRGPNSTDMQDDITVDSQVLGKAQLDWLKAELTASEAVWKVIACDMPIGLCVWDKVSEDQKYVEAIANGDNAAPKGRELEFAGLLRFIRDRGILNTVWLTADVHYTAAHEYHPDRAAFQEFAPFWEFVSGPLHAGTFGPGDLDMTFGPEVKFFKAPPEGQANLPPSAGLQFFGLVDIDGDSGQMSVRLMDRADTELWSITLDPQQA